MELLTNLKSWFAPAPPITVATAQAIASAVAIVDPRLALVSGHQRKLAPAVERALAYCDGLVAGIPGPVDINVQTFGSDPLVHAFFASPDDIRQMLGLSREVREFVDTPGNTATDVFFAMLGMRRKEKTVMGMVVQGEVIHHDMPQRLLYFADHTLRGLSADLDVTRRGLRAATFESLCESYAVRLKALRDERQHMQLEWAQHRSIDRAGGANGAALAVRQQELGRSLRQAAESLEPAHVLDALCDWLGSPELHLYLVERSVAVDRMGVIAAAGAAEPTFETLNFPELVGRDRRHWIILLARISCADALKARQQVSAANRYLVV